MSTSEVVVVSACRTPIGAFGGAFKDVSAVELGTLAVREAVRRAGVRADQVDEVILGCILQAGLGMNPARQAAIKAGLPESVPLGLPRIPGSFHPRRRGAGRLPGAAECAEVQIRLGQARPALSTTAGQHGRDCEFPGPAAPWLPGGPGFRERQAGRRRRGRWR